MSVQFPEVTHQHQQLMWSILTRKYRPGRAWHKLRFYFKFLLRCLCYPRISYRYLKTLAAFNDLAQILERQAILPAKIHRPYMTSAFGVDQRAQMILDHYQWVENLNDGRLKDLLKANQPTTLAQWQGKHAQQLRIVLGPAIYDREGELTLMLLFQNQPVTSMSFALGYDKQIPVLFIGGLQGPKAPLNQMIVREATKACDGLFPKRILTEMITLIAVSCGISEIRAVGDSSHVFSAVRYKLSKREQFVASYSDYWQTLGAEEDSRGIFNFHALLARKPLEGIASKKRAEYRRRYQLLDDLDHQFKSTLDGKSEFCDPR